MLQVAPNEIYGIDKYEGSASPVLHEENNEELNQEVHDKEKVKVKYLSSSVTRIYACMVRENGSQLLI